MKKICTSIEQSLKLKELGLNVRTADMFYMMYKNGQRPQNGDDKLNASVQYQGLWYSLDIYEDFYEDWFFKENGVYAWTLSALLRILPSFSVPKGLNSFDLTIPKLTKQEDRWICKYDGDYKMYFDENHLKEVSFESDEAIDAVYEMICWLIEERHMKLNPDDFKFKKEPRRGKI